jgi:glycine betaine/proline transport system ATP-binding protein
MTLDRARMAVDAWRMTEVKLACEAVWKLFGPQPERFLAAHQHRPTPADLAAAGLICAVREASFAIREGEIFVIMGLSGSGKSTLVRCLSRLIEPTAGRVLFEGRNLLEASERELIEIRRHKMGMVFQHFALLPHLTVLGNVAFPLEIQGQGRAAREGRAREMIELVGLKGREDYYPRELSGGQQQRVGIARSLAVGPEVWFLDEPFSALDPLIRREMQDEFLRLQSVLQKTIAFITHDFDEAIRLADRIAIMQDGEVIQIGTPEELVTRPATPYVAEFTRDIPRAKVLSAQAVMRPAAGADGCEGAVAADARIEAVAKRVMDAALPLAVTDDAGRVIGQLDRAAVLAVLIGDQPAAPGDRPAGGGVTPAAGGDRPATGSVRPAAAGVTPIAGGITPAAGGDG